MHQTACVDTSHTLRLLRLQHVPQKKWFFLLHQAVIELHPTVVLHDTQSVQSRVLPGLCTKLLSEEFLSVHAAVAKQV